MKKMFRIMVAIVIGVIAICNIDVAEGYANTVSVTFGSSSYSKISGEEFPIGVYVKSDSVIGVHAIRLKYDNQRLQYISGATKEAGGVILLKGTGGNTTVKYWLEFKAISGGNASIYSDVAKVYVNNNTELINLTTLPKAAITIEGVDIVNGINTTNDALNTEGSSANTDIDSTNTGESGIVEGEEGTLSDDNADITDETTNESQEEKVDDDDSIDYSYDEDIDDKKDKEDSNDNGKFILSVIINLVVFGVLTLVGIKIISAIGNNKKKRLSREFEDEFVNEYQGGYQNATHSDFRGDEHMSPIPFDDYDRGMYNYNDDAIRYNPNDMNGQSHNLDVEFLSHDPIIEQMGYQQNNMHTNNEFNYIEQNLERSLEQQLRDQMNDMY